MVCIEVRSDEGEVCVGVIVCVLFSLLSKVALSVCGFRVVAVLYSDACREWRGESGVEACSPVENKI